MASGYVFSHKEFTAVTARRDNRGLEQRYNKLVENFEQLQREKQELLDNNRKLSFQVSNLLQERSTLLKDNSNLNSQFPTNDEIENSFVLFNTSILGNFVYNYHHTPIPFIYTIVPTAIQKGKEQMQKIITTINSALFPSNHISNPLPNQSTLHIEIKEHLKENYKHFIEESKATIIDWFPYVSTREEEYQDNFVDMIKYLNSLVWQIQLARYAFGEEFEYDSKTGIDTVVFCNLRPGKHTNILCFPLVRLNGSGKRNVVKQGYTH